MKRFLLWLLGGMALLGVIGSLGFRFWFHQFLEYESDR